MTTLQQIKENTQLAKQTIKNLKQEINTINREYNNILARELEGENAKLEEAIIEAKNRLVTLEIQNGITQIPIPNKIAAVIEKADISTACTKADKPKFEPKAEKKAIKVAKNSTTAAQEQPVDIGRLDLRIGKIITVERHPNADSLYMMKIVCGEDNPRNVCSGLVKHVPMEELQSKIVLLLCNLKPVKMRGIVSEAMVMCASTSEKVEVLLPASGCIEGEKITCEGYNMQPDVVMNPKKKIFETVAPDLHTDDQLQACYKGVPLLVKGKGAILARTLKNAPVK